MSFKDYYKTQVQSKLSKELQIKNMYFVPKLEKVVVNVGVGEAVINKKAIEKVSEELGIITGQKPIVTKARQSIAAFKIRKGMPIGVKVTLRGEKMFSFVEKLIKIVLPRIRDFRGLSVKMLDGQGNMNLGLTEQTLFPEIEYDKIERIHGLQITIVTNTRNSVHALKLFEALGFPFREIKKA